MLGRCLFLSFKFCFEYPALFLHETEELRVFATVCRLVALV